MVTIITKFGRRTGVTVINSHTLLGITDPEMTSTSLIHAGQAIHVS